MSRASTITSSLLLALCVSGCAEPLPVRLDLCPGEGSTAEDLSLLRSVDIWSVQVWGMEAGDVAWRRTYAGATSVRSLDIADAIPPGEAVRLHVEGYGADPTGERRMLALGSSDPIILDELDSVCLCMAPPERYADLCENWSCLWDDSAGQCVAP